jgi:hypothetical protein
MRAIFALVIGISTLTALSSASAQKCPLPPGSYLASCQQCYVVYPICNTLTCNSCFVGQNDIWGNPESKPSSISMSSCPARNFWNDHGELRCGYGHHED